MVDDIVRARIVFEDGTSSPSGITGGPSKSNNGETKKVISELKGLNTNFSKFISGSLTGLMGGGVGGVGNIAKLIGAAFQSPLVIAGIGGAIAAGLISSTLARPLDDLPGPDEAENIPDVKIPKKDSEDYKDNVVEALDKFEQTPEVISNINFETGEVNKTLSLQNDTEQNIINTLSERIPLNERIQSDLDLYLETQYLSNEAARELNRIYGERNNRGGIIIGGKDSQIITPPTGNARNKGDPIFVGGARLDEKGKVIVFDKSP